MNAYPARPVAALFVATDQVEDLAAASSPEVRIGIRIDAGLPKPHPDTGVPLPLLPCPFTAVVVGEGVSALRVRVARAGVAIDLAASALVAGTEYIVKPGRGRVMVAMLVRRRAELGVAAFRDRWLDGHAAFGLRIPGAGYRQWHADRTVPSDLPAADLPAADRFDGAGVVLFDRADQVAAARADPAVARDATRDELQFVDHARSMLAMFRFSR